MSARCCASCGRIRELNMNTTNWHRHVNACKKRKQSLNPKNHTLDGFLLVKKQKTLQDVGK